MKFVRNIRGVLVKWKMVRNGRRFLMLVSNIRGVLVKRKMVGTNDLTSETFAACNQSIGAI